MLFLVMAISVSERPDLSPDALVLMYGGTFDPVHNGHLRSALELTQVLPVARVHLIPCQLPPHRGEPGASPEQRLEMLRLATAEEPLLLADNRELLRPGPSWSIDTLCSLREEYGDRQPLAMVLGWDAFLGLPAWSRREQLLEKAHLIVIARPGEKQPASQELLDLLQQYELKAGEALNTQPSGRILRLALPSAMQVSATYIRRLLAEQSSVRYLLPDAVINYLFRQGLYAPANPCHQE